jgi:transposase InsO family protein
MTKSPKRRRAERIEKRNEEFEKKRRESYYQKKRYLVTDLRAAGFSMRETASRIRMSLGFVHKWCIRLRVQIEAKKQARRMKTDAVFPRGEEIRNAVISRSRAPGNPRKRITAGHVNIIKKVRRERFTKKMGAQKMCVYLGIDISHQSVNRIMKEQGLTAPRGKRKQRSFDPFTRGYPNELWQIDYKEFGRGVYMLSVKDDYSRMIMTADVRSSCTTDDVLEIMKKTVKIFGPPKQILSDHGTQWCSSRGDNCRFDEWCSENKIEHIMGKVRKPTTQGKVERWHGSLLEEAELPPKGSSVAEYRKAVLEYMEFHNNERPHHGIGLQIPIIVYMGGLILPEVFTNLGVHEVP